MLYIFMQVFLDFHVISGDVYKLIANHWEYLKKNIILCDPCEIWFLI